MPSLIAYLQLGHETDCIGKCASHLWSWVPCNAEVTRAGCYQYTHYVSKLQTACVSYALGIGMRMQLCAGW